MGKPRMTIIESCRVRPPAGSVPLPPTHLPLTFLDLRWLFAFPMPLFFFDLPLPTDLFTATVIPRLKHSLSLALRHFFPLAADLICPPEPHKPHLRFSPSAASVSFTVAESGADFKSLVSNDPRDVAECRCLVPELPPPLYVGGDRVCPVLAIQVTVFPNSGFSVGATFNHVAADWNAFLHFFKSWALFCRSQRGGEEELTVFKPPTHVIVGYSDPYGLESVFVKNWRVGDKPDTTRDLVAHENKVRATFSLGQAQIEKLKHWASAQSEEESPSSFAVSVAFTWATLIRSKTRNIAVGDETHHLAFLADCRNRLTPATYFGNCVVPCFVSAETSEMVGENGMIAAARRIGMAVGEFRAAPMRGTATWDGDFRERMESGNLVTVAGSTRMGVYEVDFGLGKVKKNVQVHIDMTATMSVAEAVEERGGLEIGLALDKDQMEAFSVLFQRSLELLSARSSL